MRHSHHRNWASIFLEVVFLVALAVGAAGCGGSVRDGADSHGPRRPDAGTPPSQLEGSNGGTDASEGAGGARGEQPDASDGSEPVERDASRDQDAAPADAGVCSADGALDIAGDYIAPDGKKHWFRKSVTATTYTVVLSGAPQPSALPRLYRIQGICSTWLLLAGTDGSIERLDWARVNGTGGLRICVRDALTPRAAALLDTPDSSNANTGCAGAPWVSLTKAVTP